MEQRDALPRKRNISWWRRALLLVGCVILLRVGSKVLPAQDAQKTSRIAALTLLNAAPNSSPHAVAAYLKAAGLSPQLRPVRNNTGQYDWVMWESGLVGPRKTNPRSAATICHVGLRIQRQFGWCQPQQMELCFIFDKKGRELKRFTVEKSCLATPEF